jgi:molybdate transport system substrate-binding protein
MKNMTILPRSSGMAGLCMTSRTRPLATILAVVLVLAGCTKSRPSGPAQEQGLTVFAAASLREPFSRLGKQFHNEHPNVLLAFQFAGTQELRTQLEHGARADVFASADQWHMNDLARSGLVLSPTVFVQNEPVLVVARTSATSLRSLADLPSMARVVLGVPEVPIGRYAIQVLERASALYGPDFRLRVEAKVCSREFNVKQVLTKVAMGEAQAGIVYRSDVTPPEETVDVVTIDPEVNVLAEYPIAVVSDSTRKELAQRWVTFVLSSKGQVELSKAGFTIPLRVATTP